MKEVTEVINPKPTIKEIKESEIQILNDLNQKQIVLFIDKEYGELLDMEIKNSYSYEDYVRKSEKFSQYWKFFTSQNVYKSQAFYRGFGMAYNRKFFEVNTYNALEQITSLILKLNHFIIDFSYTSKMLIEVLGIVFENVDSDTDFNDNPLLDGYNKIIEELYVSAYLSKMDIENILPIINVYDFEDFVLSPGMVEELKLEEYDVRLDNFKFAFNHFKKISEEYSDIIIPIFEKLSEDGFASFKEQLKPNNPKQKLRYDMNKFRVKLEK